MKRRILSIILVMAVVFSMCEVSVLGNAITDGSCKDATRRIVDIISYVDPDYVTDYGYYDVRKKDSWGEQDLLKYNELKKVVDNVLTENNAKDASDYEKAKALAFAIAERLHYDFPGRDGEAPTSHEPYTVWYLQYSICDGFSNLYKALLDIAGIPSQKMVSGGAVHSWNLVYDKDGNNGQGRWFPVDTTWMCGGGAKLKESGDQKTERDFYKISDVVETWFDHESDDPTAFYYSGYHMPDYVQGIKDRETGLYYTFYYSDIMYAEGEVTKVAIPTDTWINKWASQSGWNFGVSAFTLEEENPTVLNLTYPTSFLDLDIIDSDDSLFEQINQYKSLRELKISGGVRTFIRRSGKNAQNLGNMPNLEIVDLSQTNLEQINPNLAYKSHTGAFENDTKLKKVILPKTLKYIGLNTFSGCSSLKSLDLSGTKLEALDGRAFAGCTGLETLDVSNTKISSLIWEYDESDANEVLLGVNKLLKGMNRELLTNCTNLKHFNLSNNGITSIYDSGSSIFARNLSLESIDLSGNSELQSIKGLAMIGCEKLESIDLSGCTSLTSLGRYAFADCPKLSLVILPDSFGGDKIGDMAFRIFPMPKTPVETRVISSKSATELEYEGSATGKWAGRTLSIINPTASQTDISTCTVEYTSNSVYDGTSKKANIVVKDGTKELVEGADYYVIGAGDNTTGGEHIEFIYGLGAYAGKKAIEYTIDRKEQNFTLSCDGSIEFGESKVLSVSNVQGTSKYSSSDKSIATVDSTGRVTGKGLGEATITLKTDGDENYLGASKSIKVTIVKKPLASTYCKLSSNEFTYTGEEIRPEVTIRIGSTILVEGIDYTLNYKNNKSIGRGSVEITGIGNYSGSFTRTFSISSATSSTSPCETGWYKLRINSNYFLATNYDGKAILMQDTTTGGSESDSFYVELKEDGDYTIKTQNEKYLGASSTENGSNIMEQEKEYVWNLNVEGPATNDGNLFGIRLPSDKTKYFDVKDSKYTNWNAIILKSKGSSSATTPTNDKFRFVSTKAAHIHKYVTSVKPATTTEDGYHYKTCSTCKKVLKKTIPKIVSCALSATKCAYTGKKLKPKVKYIKDSNGNTIDSKYYTVTYTKNKNIGTGKATITFKGNYDGKMTKSFTINPKAPTLTKVKSISRGFTAKWSKATGSITGYKVVYSAKANFSAAKVVMVKASATTVTVKNLISRGKYYVRVSSYKKIKKKDYNSKGSKKKIVVTK